MGEPGPTGTFMSQSAGLTLYTAMNTQPTLSQIMSDLLMLGLILHHDVYDGFCSHYTMISVEMGI